jgi:hypothetical protein
VSYHRIVIDNQHFRKTHVMPKQKHTMMIWLGASIFLVGCGGTSEPETPTEVTSSIHEFDMIMDMGLEEQMVLKGVARLSGDELQLATGLSEDRILKFETEQDDFIVVLTLERQGETTGGDGLAGTWKVTAAERDGAPFERPVGDTVVFTADTMTNTSSDGKIKENKYRLGGTPKPAPKPVPAQAEAVAMFKNIDAHVRLNADGEAVRLRLWSHEVTDKQMLRLAELSTLQDLELSVKNLTQEGLSVLSQLKQLRKLQLEYLPTLAELDDVWGIEDEWLQPLTGLNKLEELILESCHRVDGTGLKYIAGLTSLKKLDLGGTSVTDASLIHITGLQNLAELSLQGSGFQNGEAISEITDKAVKHLVKLKGLRSLNIKSTRISAEGVKQLEAALPACKIQVSAAPNN